MIRTASRSILLYLALVGLPVVGVLGILHLGQRLTAPVSVGGAWIVEIAPGSATDPSCADPPIRSNRPVLTISQSGPRLALILNNGGRTNLTGEIRGVTITAGEPRPPEASAVNTSHPAIIAIHAAVDRLPEPDRLRGLLTVSGCRAAVSFAATRQRGN